MKTALALAAATAFATLSVPALAATQFTVDTGASSLTVSNNTTTCLFGTCSLSTGPVGAASFPLEVGHSETFDFANIFVSRGFGTGSATINAILTFLPPVGGSANSTGSANYFRFGGFFTPGILGGSLIWDGPQDVTGADGSNYTVAFGNLLGIEFGSNVAVPVTVTLNSIGAVPEPATWAMLLIGFGAAGASMRYRRKQAVRVTYA